MPRKSSNIWKLDNILLNNPWVRKKLKGDIENILIWNYDENKTYQILWDAVKAMLKHTHTHIYNFKCNIRDDIYTSEIKSI